MKPWELLGETVTPEGDAMRLTRRDTEYIILVNGKPLMSSRMHGSEEALASAACRDLAAKKAGDDMHVLVGGLGMGFTLRAALDLLPPGAIVTVSELVPAVVDWNRGPLAPLAGHPLHDPRVRVAVGDVGALLRASPAAFDAVMLDVDNGPDSFTAAANDRLYDNAGVTAARASLKPGGTLAVWSAWEDRKFEQRLRFHGFDVEVQRVRARLKQGGPRHTIFVGRKKRG